MSSSLHSRSLDLSAVEAEDFLEQLGVLNIQQATEDEILFSCPFAGHTHGDETPSAYMNTGSVEPEKATLWFCHSCKRKGNAISFLAEHENVEYLTATRWLQQHYDTTFREPIGGSFAAEWDAHFAPVEEKPVSNQPIGERFIQDMMAGSWDQVPDDDYMIERGFTRDTLNSWQIGWDEISQRYAIPVRGNTGALIGFKGRTPYADVKPKYLVLGDDPNDPDDNRYGFPRYEVSQVLFGLDRVGQVERLIVIEGELNTMSMHQRNHINSAGIGGSYLTDTQAKLIRWHADEAVFFFDSDNASDRAVWGWTDEYGKYHPGAVALLEPFMRVLVVPEHEGDPNSMSDDQVQECLDLAVPSVHTIF